MIFALTFLIYILCLTSWHAFSSQLKVIVFREFTVATHLLCLVMEEMEQCKIPLSVHLFQSGISCNRPVTFLFDTMGWTAHYLRTTGN